MKIYKIFCHYILSLLINNYLLSYDYFTKINIFVLFSCIGLLLLVIGNWKNLNGLK